MRQSYRSDLTDARWEVIKTSIPPTKPGGRRFTCHFRNYDSSRDDSFNLEKIGII